MFFPELLLFYNFVSRYIWKYFQIINRVLGNITILKLVYFEDYFAFVSAEDS
jgi:hypothetical protein